MYGKSHKLAKKITQLIIAIGNSPKGFDSIDNIIKNIDTLSHDPVTKVTEDNTFTGKIEWSEGLEDPRNIRLG